MDTVKDNLSSRSRAKLWSPKMHYHRPTSMKWVNWNQYSYDQQQMTCYKFMRSIRLLMEIGATGKQNWFVGSPEIGCRHSRSHVFHHHIRLWYLPERGVVVRTGSCPLALKTQSDATMQPNNIECSENRVDTKQIPLSCSVAVQKLILELSKAPIPVRTSASVLQLVSTLEELTQKRIELMARGIGDVVSGRPFAIGIADWSTKHVTQPMELEVTNCSVPPATTLNSLSDLVNVVQMHENQA